MSSEIAVPFALTPGGGIATETNPDRQVLQHVRTLIGTRPGERVMLSAYGVPTTELIFEPDGTAEQDLATMVDAALRDWEPGAVGAQVEAVTTPDGTGLAAVNLRYARSETLTTTDRLVNRALIKVGGQVRESIGA